MDLPNLIQFDGKQGKRTYGPRTEEYKALMLVQEDGRWADYCNEMISNGVYITYDRNGDFFAVKTDNQMNENKDFLYDEENLDLEGDLDSYLGSEDSEEEVYDEEPQEIKNNTPQMQVVSLEDVLSIIKEMGIGSQNATVAPAEVTSLDGEESFDQDLPESVSAELNDVLNSEFEVNQSAIASLENVDSPDVTVSDVAAPQNAGGDKYNGMVYGGSTTYDDMDSGSFENPDISRLNGEVDLFTGEDDAEEAPQMPEETEQKEILHDEEEPQDFLDEDMEIPEDMHPDLARIVGPIDPVEEDEFEVDTFEPEEFDTTPEPVVPSTTINKSVNCCGMPIQLVLTGVIISPKEIQYIGESVKNSGATLKEIRGEGEKLQVVVVSENKKYVINYIDMPKVQNPTPFSISNHKFNTLEEALSKISKKNHLKESKVFESIVGNELAKRSLNEFKEADIFNDFGGEVNYNMTWTVQNTGLLDLKTGLNEVFSRVTEHGRESNTLVKTEDNKFFVIKGNLKERSKVGTRRELVDAKGKSLGLGEVIGVYENTSKGLGQIMYETKRTVVPLLVWK